MPLRLRGIISDHGGTSQIGEAHTIDGRSGRKVKSRRRCNAGREVFLILVGSVQHTQTNILVQSSQAAYNFMI